jgi:1-acyl-sn-glycerol-3-phosphate acyltransferase
LHHSCRRVLRVFVNEVALTGPRPRAGLLISNHLSYLDILVLSTAAPCVFVSKHEVKSWPLFGWFATLGGTVYIQRERRGEVGAVAGEIRRLLAEGVLVVLFPEGTSSGGREILPFKSSLLEPAVGLDSALFVSCISYSLPGGVISEDVCYWGDMTLLPHFVKLLKKPFVQARVIFGEIREPAADRKTLAKQLHTEVVRLKSLPAG